MSAKRTNQPGAFVPIAELESLRKDAERWRKLRAMVRGERSSESARPAHFAFPTHMELTPLADIMRGSVAQHLDAAIDAAMSDAAAIGGAP